MFASVYALIDVSGSAIYSLPWARSLHMGAPREDVQFRDGFYL